MEKAKKNKRTNTRSVVWEGVVATIHVEDHFAAKGRKNLVSNGAVKDISALGMFLYTGDAVPLDANAIISIDFNSRKPGRIMLNAEGKVVRRDARGVGIQFTRINLPRLQQCIMERMNDSK